MAILLNSLELKVKELNDRFENDVKIDYILCGDFNSFPNSGVCELIESGCLPGNHTDYYSGKFINQILIK